MSLCDAFDVGMADTCCGCGGSASLGGTQRPVAGSVPALQYCSTDCRDDWENYLAEMDEKRRLRREFEDWEDALYAESWVTSEETQ